MASLLVIQLLKEHVDDNGDTHREFRWGDIADSQHWLSSAQCGDGDALWWSLRHSWRYKPLSHRMGMAFGPARMRRDIGRIQSALVNDGPASWLVADQIDEAAGRVEDAMGGEAAAREEPNAAEVELNRSAEAVRQLLLAE